MRKSILFASVLMLAAGSVGAQTPAHDPSERLNGVLPADVAARVKERIAAARAVELPAQALENRVLELASKGATPAEIEQKVDGYAKAMELAKDALARGRGQVPTDDEVAAGGDAIARGVNGQDVATLARTAPAERSVAVPLYVLGALMEHHDLTTALAAVTKGLEQRVSDAEMQGWVDELPAVAADRRPSTIGAGAAHRPDFATIPAGVPANPGTGAKPPVAPPTQTPPVTPPPPPEL